MEITSDDVLFVGLGSSSVPSWYRCALPARYLGARWINVIGDPGQFRLISGWQSTIPRFDDFKIVVIQQPMGDAWMYEIQRLENKGIIVLYDVDDNLGGVSQQEDHQAKEFWTDDIVKQHTDCMESCTGIIVSTPYLAEIYSTHGKTFVCRNGIDSERYNVTIPKRDCINIGWAGGVGHRLAVESWLPAVKTVMRKYDHTRFVTIGEPVADDLRDEFGNRALSIPFCAIEHFPGVLCNIDIGLAPARDTPFYRGKSDLRFLEYGAVGIPGIYHPLVYDQVDKGVTGYVTDNPKFVQYRLDVMINNKQKCDDVGAAARYYVHSQRRMEVAVEQWIKVFEEIT
jgi:glycosyltransferase involved in cell wall biosynthesis